MKENMKNIEKASNNMKDAFLRYLNRKEELNTKNNYEILKILYRNKEAENDS